MASQVRAGGVGTAFHPQLEHFKPQIGTIKEVEVVPQYHGFPDNDVRTRYEDVINDIRVQGGQLIPNTRSRSRDFERFFPNPKNIGAQKLCGEFVPPKPTNSLFFHPTGFPNKDVRARYEDVINDIGVRRGQLIPNTRSTWRHSNIFLPNPENSDAQKFRGKFVPTKPTKSPVPDTGSEANQKTEVGQENTSKIRKDTSQKSSVSAKKKFEKGDQGNIYQAGTSTTDYTDEKLNSDGQKFRGKFVPPKPTESPFVHPTGSEPNQKTPVGLEDTPRISQNGSVSTKGDQGNIYQARTSTTDYTDEKRTEEGKNENGERKSSPTDVVSTADGDEKQNNCTPDQQQLYAVVKLPPKMKGIRSSGKKKESTTQKGIESGGDIIESKMAEEKYVSTPDEENPNKENGDHSTNKLNEEDRQKVINVGVAVLALLSLGACLGYNFGCSEKTHK